jgi:hypothetical protein
MEIDSDRPRSMLRPSTNAIPTGGALNSHGFLTACPFVFKNAFVS